jgi:hypothetical protein
MKCSNTSTYRNKPELSPLSLQLEHLRLNMGRRGENKDRLQTTKKGQH